MEGSDPDLASFLERDSRILQFIWSVDVGVFACLATTLGFSVDEDRGSAFWHEKDDGLDDTAEDELDPEEPLPAEDYARDGMLASSEDRSCER